MFKSGSADSSDDLDLQLESIYKSRIFSYGTEPVVLFVGLAESFCL